ncbi:hypothetical protein [Streptomyces sp. SM1]|uniref:hypothetical protein n=1 Tax=Streptomyces sp. SM1 TaxID=402229 RepID=UPI0015E1AC11|nr:hypothetical protein [Streptomyces sp. SM1]
MGLSEVTQTGRVAAKTVGERARDAGRSPVEEVGAIKDLGDVLVGAGNVPAAGDASIKARGVFDAAMAESLFALVDTHQQSVGIVVDGQLRVGNDLSSLTQADDRAGVLHCGGSGCDSPPGGRSRDAKAVFEVVVQVSDGVNGRPGGLDVEEVVDPVTASGGVSDRYGSSQVRVIA